ncbi:hypothetical protein [Photobacterium carnosum]|uniref:hypothetical protein n=1 Tax=Photobacterium carnosum TaxID=2023717 RepID=UPI001E2F112A|nr:hypothetical protein [Photobacterium carnosum]MCD9528497.1 hypothetical protein [Photobacterium carnosum]
MKIKYLNEDSLLSISDLTSARLAQINFISEHVQFRVEALSKVADFNGEIPSKIYRCHIVNYVRDNLFGKQNSKKMAAEISRTNASQERNGRAEFLPYTPQFIAMLKELFISALFLTKQRSTERTRVVVYKDEMVDVKSLINLPEFLFLDELIDLSYFVACWDAGFNTFNKSDIGIQFRSVAAKAGSLNLKKVVYHEQSVNRISQFFDFNCCSDPNCPCQANLNKEITFNNSSPFTIANDDNYKFSVFIPNEEPSNSVIVLTNEERYESLDNLKAKLPTIKKYNCFSQSEIYIVNVKNGNRSHGDAPVEVYSYMDAEFHEVSIATRLACCLVDFSGAACMMNRTFSLKEHEIEPKPKPQLEPEPKPRNLNQRQQKKPDQKNKQKK